MPKHKRMSDYAAQMGRWRSQNKPRAGMPLWLPLWLLLSAAACGGNAEDTGEVVRVTVPRGSGLSATADSLAAHGVVTQPTLFRLYARAKGAAAQIKPGVYELARGASWAAVLNKLTSGDVVTTTIAIPEGWTARRIAERIAAATGTSADSLTEVLLDTASATRFGVPGPTLEGYLYPATYTFPLGTPPADVVQRLVSRYQQVWTPARRARADSVGLSEREIVTLASIVEGEARVWDERGTIAAVYHNRLRHGMRLQADPTVQYALGERQRRLLFSHIADVADSPYNTYTHSGLPPGPIGSPSAGAIEAALNPTEDDYLFFVAGGDGRHVFTRTFAEHRAAVRRARQARPAPAQ